MILTLALAWTLALPAQDMPLSSILVEGAGWRQTGWHWLATPAVQAGGVRYIPTGEGLSVLFTDGSTRIAGLTPKASCTAVTVLSGDGCVVASFAGNKQLWAFPRAQDGSLGVPTPYFSLARNPGQPVATVLALQVDLKGRLWAVTNQSLQVWDPLGRLCGVIESPQGAATPHLEITAELVVIRRGMVSFSRPIQVGSPEK